MHSYSAEDLLHLQQLPQFDALGAETLTQVLENMTPGEYDLYQDRLQRQALEEQYSAPAVRSAPHSPTL